MLGEPENIDVLYQRIGEFVVSFQWLEHRFRELGWLIADPHRENWPPTILRVETNSQLLNKVEEMYHNAMDLQYGEQHSHIIKEPFSLLIKKAHEFRSYRNKLLHSAFIELKGGGEVLHIMRSNPRMKKDEDGEYCFDSEILTVASIEAKMKEMGELALMFNTHYMQLIHSIPIK